MFFQAHYSAPQNKTKFMLAPQERQVKVKTHLFNLEEKVTLLVGITTTVCLSMDFFLSVSKTLLFFFF